MAVAYGLHQWAWSESEQSHVPPDGAVDAIDLRPRDEQAKPTQSDGYGLFGWPDEVTDESGVLMPNPHAMPLDAVPLGYGDVREITLNAETRDELRRRLGLSSSPSGETLVDVIDDVLGPLSDPTGLNGAKPAIPGRRGRREICFASSGRVFASKFAGGAMFSTTATGLANRVRDVLRSDLETANKSGGPNLAAKVLGCWCDRWGVRYDEAVRWRNLVRPSLLVELLSKSGGAFKPKKPQTSYSDDFSGTLAGWTQVSGTWTITSGQLVCGTSGVQSIRYESDLSSSDHWATLTQLSGGSPSTRPFAAVRFASAANTCYACNGTSGGFTLGKIVAGTYTALSTTVSGTGIDTCETRAAGSTISITRVTGADVSLTDTSITGNTRCGVGEGSAAGTATPVDGWSCDDGVSFGGIVVYAHRFFYHLRR